MSLTRLFRTALCEIMNLDAKIYNFEVEDFHTCYIISTEENALIKNGLVNRHGEILP